MFSTIAKLRSTGSRLHGCAQVDILITELSGTRNSTGGRPAIIEFTTPLALGRHGDVITGGFQVGPTQNCAQLGAGTALVGVGEVRLLRPVIQDVSQLFPHDTMAQLK